MRATMEAETENAVYDVTLYFDEGVEESLVSQALSEFDHLILKWKGATGGFATRVGGSGMRGDPFPVIALNPSRRKRIGLRKGPPASLMSYPCCHDWLPP